MKRVNGQRRRARENSAFNRGLAKAKSAADANFKKDEQYEASPGVREALVADAHRRF
jgi:hypothetical protein